jgi:hypothetical protein
MKAVFRREPSELGNGATLWRWQLRTAEGAVIDPSLPTAPTLQDGQVYFVTAESVASLDDVEFVARVSEMNDGKPMTLYRIARISCAVTGDSAGTRTLRPTRPRPGRWVAAEPEPTR